jgi:hypothetical protein
MVRRASFAKQKPQDKAGASFAKQKPQDKAGAPQTLFEPQVPFRHVYRKATFSIHDLPRSDMALRAE